MSPCLLKAASLIVLLLSMIPAEKAAAAVAETPALVTRACGPGDFWYRTELLILSPEGALARIEFEEHQLKTLAAGRHIELNADDGEFGDNPIVALKLRNGMALFPCAVGDACRAVRGDLHISAYELGKRFSGKLTWSSGVDRYEASFSASTWLLTQPECM